jgi:cell filamentation protein
MESKTDETTPTAENKLGITDKEALNIAEAEGLTEAELFLLFNSIEKAKMTTDLVLETHETAFGNMYDWAGKWRKIDVQVGSLVLPKQFEIPILMRQLCDDVQFRMQFKLSKSEVAELMAQFHHRFVAIHPFNNGNGRTARMLSNLLGMLNGYNPVRLYEPDGEARKIYISALRSADSGDLTVLQGLIEQQLSKL